jgi:hypothetical protein
LPPSTEGALDMPCTNGGSAISGGVDLGGYNAGETIVADSPETSDGTPIGWYANAANPGSTTVLMTGYVVCVTPAAGTSSDAKAKATVPARAKETLTSLAKAG